MSKLSQELTPQSIVAALDKYIVGQNSAKRNVAIALRNRWRRMQVQSSIKGDIIPNNILMIGATGVGKTEIARRLAKIADAPFVKVEASKFTEVGYVGRDVESMVRDLVAQSVSLVKAAKAEEVKAQAKKVVEEQIVDALIPPLTNTREERGEAIDETATNLNEKTRERFREKIRLGEFDNRKIEISVSKPSTMGVGMVGGGAIDEASMIGLQDMISSMLPKRKKKKKITIAEAKKVLLAEEVAKLVDMDVVKEEACKKAEETGIIFIDEIDKIATRSSKGSGPDVSREGVQRDLLPIVEGSSVNTKYGTINTNHVLFIAAGAFHVSKPSDLIPEFQGRFPIRVELEALTKEDFKRILKEPKNALTAQYKALFEAEGVALSFTNDAVDEIANMSYQMNEEVENIGARRLHTVMSHLLNDYLFDVPDSIKSGEKVEITQQFVTDRLQKLVNKKDLREYIL